MGTILVVGTVAIDSIETPFGKEDEVLGGSATHFAAAASFLAPVRLVGIVGEDFPLDDLKFLKARKVDLSGLKVGRGKSFRWAGRYSYDMNRRDTLRTELGVIENYSPEIPAEWKNPDHLFLGNIDPKFQMKVLEEAGRPKKIYIDTMNLWIETQRKWVEEVLAKAHLVVINEEEARQLTKETSLVKAAKQIGSWGPVAIVIKRGEYGALLFYKGEIFSAPGLQLEEVKDPTGAGDTFAGGLVGYLAMSDQFDFEHLKKGVIIGSAMASFNVEDFGPNRLKDLEIGEIQGRIAEFQKLGSFGKIEI